MNKQEQLLLLLGQQRQQVNHSGFQQKQLQLLEMQTQLRSLLEHLKRQEGFDELSEQEQQQVLIRKYAQQVEQMQQHRVQDGSINPGMLPRQQSDRTQSDRTQSDWTSQYMGTNKWRCNDSFSSGRDAETGCKKSETWRKGGS